jgi:uncharacterized protein YjiS (DUF1127 family)
MTYQSRGRLEGASGLFITPTAARQSWLARAALTLAVWRQRMEMRRCLAHMDARSLRDAGISPAAAAFEAGKPFWRKAGPLR